MHKMFCAVLTLLLLTAVSAEAQQTKRIPRIGFISPASSPTAAPNLEALRQGLREAGYTEGKGIVIEARWAEGAAERFPKFLTELNQLKVDVIVIGAAAGAVAAKKSGLATPIVFAAVTDPLGQGIVESLARPGGNITGVALAIGEGFSGKWVELLKESVPKVDRSALLRNPTHPLASVFMRETQAAARALRLKLDPIDARDRDELASVLLRLAKERTPALIVTPDPVFTAARSRIVDFVARHQLPSVFFSGDFVEAGGLMSYGPSFPESYRRAAFYVDKILKGAKPADLPIEQPTKFELVINLKMAKQIGLTIPPNVLSRADKVIR
ncbi:MAG TPA: ABC transporter substrate-binding protein [Gammaproteobacteria bacterium]|nr:ABC transporter substrate-binding protein [Gammaproteobacteria bacterium]